jgi:opacity protein-like surface antigen
MMMKKYAPLMLLLLFCCTQTKAQLLENTGIGVWGGVSGYKGSMPKTLMRGAAGIYLHYDLTDKFAVRLQFMASETGGSDSSLNNAANNGNDARSQSYYFHTNINEISLMPEYNFFDLRSGAKFTPYIFAGIAYYSFKPYQIVATTATGTLHYVNLAMPKVTNYSYWQMAVPLGIGVKYALSPNVFLHAEGNYRILFNPYLDNYSADNKNDKYYTISIGITVKLKPASSTSNRNGRNCKCPPVY